MSYEPEKSYVRIFDPTQAPNYLEMLAARFGFDRQQLPPSEPKVYLDLGCAQGHAILCLAPLYPDIQFIGVDFNPAHISAAVSEAAEYQIPNVRFIQADFRDLPDDLPLADFVICRGVYSWLSQEIKTALEKAFERLSKPGAIIRIDACVMPGTVPRDTIMRGMLGILGSDAPPQACRELASLLAAESRPLAGLFTNATSILQELSIKDDSYLAHDLLNADFEIEYAHEIISRISRLGFTYVADCGYAKNFPSIQVSPSLQSLMERLSDVRKYTLYDLATANGRRSLIFAKEAARSARADFPPSLPFSVTAYLSCLGASYKTSRGEVLFTHPTCQAIMSMLVEQMASSKEISQRMSAIEPKDIRLWLDLMLVSRKILPGLTPEQMALIDSGKVLAINRQRLRASTDSLSHKTQTPLMSLKTGNCIIFGWLETLALAWREHLFSDPATDDMLDTMHRAGIFFSQNPNGTAQAESLADNQKEQLIARLNQIQKDVLERLDYWQIPL